MSWSRSIPRTAKTGRHQCNLNRLAFVKFKVIRDLDIIVKRVGDDFFRHNIFGSYSYGSKVFWVGTLSLDTADLEAIVGVVELRQVVM